MGNPYITTERKSHMPLRARRINLLSTRHIYNYFGHVAYRYFGHVALTWCHVLFIEGIFLNIFVSRFDTFHCDVGIFLRILYLCNDILTTEQKQTA